MEYKRFGSKIIVRIDKDEEILEKVKELALKENIRLAAVQALGATNSFTVGVYNVGMWQELALLSSVRLQQRPRSKPSFQ